MPRITKIYTRTGDDGSTALGGGRRVQKDALRVETYGTVDELNAALGVARAVGVSPEIEPELARIQNELFHLGSDLCMLEEDKAATPVPRIEAHHVDTLESLIDRLSQDLPALENFILPGGSVVAAQLHVARTVCRRAERLVARLSRDESINPEALRYLNRLSDALFAMARFENRQRGVEDVLWDSRA